VADADAAAADRRRRRDALDPAELGLAGTSRGVAARRITAALREHYAKRLSTRER